MTTAGRAGHSTDAGARPFFWAAGIEDTFIGAPHHVTGRLLDEYLLTEHYDRWEADLALLSKLGVNAARYGIPWYRIAHAPGRYDWSWTDRVLERLATGHGIEPLVDLVHYGTPLWLEGSFLHPDYPKYVAEFAQAFARRYRSLCRWYTPLNEPRVNAWYAGRLGWWPPCRRSWRGFVDVLLQICRGVCLTQQAVSAEAPGSLFLHVDATDLYVPAPADDSGLAAEAARRQEIVFLALDLVHGRVTADHPLAEWLNRHGFAEKDAAWFHANRVRADIIGYNMYPMFSRKQVLRTPSGGIRVRNTPCWAETLSDLTRMYSERYAPTPVMVTETACTGPVSKRIRWIDDSIAALLQARRAGIPVVGYTYWPLFSLVTWAYRNGSEPLERYLLDMGLWDLRPGPTGLERVETAAAGAYGQAMQVAMPDLGSI